MSLGIIRYTSKVSGTFWRIGFAKMSLSGQKTKPHGADQSSHTLQYKTLRTFEVNSKMI